MQYFKYELISQSLGLSDLTRRTFWAKSATAPFLSK